MAGAACKVIIDNGYRAAAESLETILMHPLVRDIMLPAKECDVLIQKLADIDLAAYQGTAVPHSGLVGIMVELQTAGVFTEEIWGIFARPKGG